MNVSSSKILKRRFNGVFLILSGVMPIVLVLSFFLVLLTIVGDVKGLVSGPLNGIQSALVDVKDAAEDVGDVVNNVTQPIQEINQSLKDALATIDNIPKQLEFPDLQIPDITLPIEPDVAVSGGIPPSVDVRMKDVSVQIPAIPGFQVEFLGLSQIVEALSANLNILSSLSDVILNIPGLDTLREESRAIMDSSYEIVRIAQLISIKAAILILLAAFVLIPLWIKTYITPYLRWAKKQVTKGFQLLRDPSAVG